MKRWLAWLGNVLLMTVPAWPVLLMFFGLYASATSQLRFEYAFQANAPILLGACLFSLGIWLQNFLRDKKPNWPIVAIPFAIAFFWIATGTYECWPFKNDEGTEIYEVRSRRSSAIVSRAFYGDGWTMKGPYTASGKQHGEWSFSQYKPTFSSERWFYWYGEEVTEGEWHLRNK